MKRKHFLWVCSVYNGNFKFEGNRGQWNALRKLTTSLDIFRFSFKDLFSKGDNMFFEDEFRLIQFMFKVESGSASINAELELIGHCKSKSTIPDLFETCEQVLKKHKVKVYRIWKFYEKR